MEYTTLRTPLSSGLADLITAEQLCNEGLNFQSHSRDSRYVLAVQRAPVLLDLIGAVAKDLDVLPSSIAKDCPLPDRMALLEYAQMLQRTRQGGFCYL